MRWTAAMLVSVALLVGASAGVLVTPAPARAAATWLGGSELAPCSVNCGTPAVGVDPSGGETVAYEDNGDLMVTVHPAGGTWSSSPANLGYGDTPLIATDAAGDTFLVYLDGGGVNAAVTPAGTPWSAMTPVQTLGNETTGAASLAVDARGDALVAWAQTRGSGAEAVYTDYRPAGGAWQPKLEIEAQAVDTVTPAVAFNAAGQATLVWATENGSDEAVVADTMTTGGNWTAPLQIATAKDLYYVAAAVDAAGDLTAAWSGYDNSAYVIASADKAASSDTWSTPATLGTNTAMSSDNVTFSLAVNGADGAAIVWADGNTVQARQRPAGGTWGAMTPLDTDPVNHESAVIAPDGTATVVWGTAGGGSEYLWAAQASPGGTWQTPVTISNPGVEDDSSAAVADAGGDVDVVADLFDGTSFPIWAFTEDVAGPNLSELSIPSTGTVGIPVNFSVSAVDAWSPILSTQWSFGDGQSLTDQAVSHTYGAPGTYRVQLRSSDVLGNATTTSAPITIAAASTTTTTTPTATATTPTIPAATTPIARATLPLTLRSVTQLHPRWREPSRAHATAPRRSRAPLDTRFGYTLNQKATVTFTFALRLPGRRAGGRCRAHRTRGARCTATVVHGHLTVHAAKGHHTERFTGKLNGHLLPAGTYTVTVHAAATAKGAGAVTRRLRFTIVGD